ncbi:MAG: hypothetical protein J6C40_11635, partial [Lentisphaeria bacterium]|nr:hypothetical protein [Lentisphaeria bacterium]
RLFVVYGGKMTKNIDIESIDTGDSGLDDPVWLSKFFEKEQNVLVFVNIYYPCSKFSSNNNKCVCALPDFSNENAENYNDYLLSQLKDFDSNCAAFVKSLLNDYSANKKNKVRIYIYGHPCGGRFFDVLQDIEVDDIAFYQTVNQLEIYKKGYYSGSFVTDEISDSEHYSILYSIGHGDFNKDQNYSCFIHMQNKGGQQYSFIKDQYLQFFGAFNFENLIKGFSNRIDRNGYFLLHLFHCYSATNFSYTLDRKKVTTSMSKSAAEIMRNEDKLQGQIMGSNRDFTFDKDGNITNSSFSYIAP